MRAIGWIWACLMLLGGVRAHLAHSLPGDLVWAMILSGIAALPLLWDREDGPLAAFAPSGLVRAGLAVLVLAIGGVAHPSAVMGLVQI
jgi:hypothetical protein